AGLTTGLIATAVSQQCNRPCLVLEDDALARHEAHMALHDARIARHEELIRRAKCRQERHNAFVHRRHEARFKARERVRPVRQKRYVEVDNFDHNAMSSLERRNLELRERQLELELLKEKKELLQAENKRMELALKEKELSLIDNRSRSNFDSGKKGVTGAPFHYELARS
ncbi:hypothetical protein H0X06_05600, partial [Candidatus Dependentiae bacterium]|nr:hypothetical protein [Candidatus Dependentiae bacterium]